MSASEREKIVSDREKGLAAVTLVVLLYGILFMLFNGCNGKGGQKGKIASIRARRTEREALYAEYTGLIEQHQIWSDAYAKNADLMPVFEPGQQVQTYWLGVLDRLAVSNDLSIIRRQVGEERQEGDVYELPIECKEWEGSLESLTKFLYDVHAEGAMLDVRKLFIRPGPRGLRGSFTLFCAFLRSENGAAEREADSR